MDDSTNTYGVTQVCTLTGVTPKQLRDWDHQGILVAARTGDGVANNRKVYTDEDIDRIREILLLKQFGFSLAEIKRFPELTESERYELLANCIARSQEQQARIKRQILMSTTAESLGFESVKADLAIGSGYETLAEDYANNESLQRLVHWLRSHTDRDVEQFVYDLGQVCAGFASLRERASWDDVETQIGRFCDVMSTCFGWPTVGQMLGISLAFSETNTLTEEINRTLGDGTCAFIATTLFLAWTSSAAESLDGIMATLYHAFLDRTESDLPTIPRNHNDDVYTVIRERAEALVAMICEFGSQPRLFAIASKTLRSQYVMPLLDEVFDCWEEAFLDETVGWFLDLDDFPAIDGESLATARSIARAQVAGDLDAWLDQGGLDEIKRQSREWYDSVAVLRQKTAQGTEAEAKNTTSHETDRCTEDDTDTTSRETNRCTGDDTGMTSRGEENSGTMETDFPSWFDAWYTERYADVPEGTWATEEESCERERMTREIIEAADDERSAPFPEGET